MTERALSGLAVSGGVAVGSAFTLAEPAAVSAADGPEAALAALAHVAEELGRTAARLTAHGKELQAEIIEANRMMAEDPSLRADVEVPARLLAQHRSEPLHVGDLLGADALLHPSDQRHGQLRADVRAEQPLLQSLDGLAIDRKVGRHRILDLLQDLGVGHEQPALQLLKE